MFSIRSSMMEDDFWGCLLGHFACWECFSISLPVIAAMQWGRRFEDTFLPFYLLRVLLSLFACPCSSAFRTAIKASSPSYLAIDRGISLRSIVAYRAYFFVSQFVMNIWQWRKLFERTSFLSYLFTIAHINYVFICLLSYKEGTYFFKYLSLMNLMCLVPSKSSKWYAPLGNTLFTLLPNWTIICHTLDPCRPKGVLFSKPILLD